MTSELAAERIERFVRTHFRIALDDPGFSRSVPLFEAGYVDSVGVVELLEFISEDFGVEVPDEALGTQEFSTVDGIASIVTRLLCAAAATSAGWQPQG